MNIVEEIIKGHFPQYWYKYRSISRAKEIITGGDLYFSSPKNFNDPYDCQIIQACQYEKKDIINLFSHADLCREHPEILNYIENTIDDNIDNGKLYEVIECAFRNNLYSKGVCCFSSIFDSILMWSHYAENHKGVCLKFDVIKDPPFFDYPLLMSYEDEYPQINFAKDSMKCIMTVLGTKYAGWGYEKELRVYKKQMGIYPFLHSALVEIIFGCKAEEKDISEIMSLVSKYHYDITFSKMIMSKQKFNLKKIEL